MERRRDVRVNLDQMVRVTALSGNREAMQGMAADLSGRGIRVLVPERLAAGDPVRIDLDDALLLGEVCYCEPCESGFLIGVELDQVLNGLAALERLNRVLLNDGGERETERGALSYSISEQA